MKRILVADDEYSLRLVLKEFLSDLRYVVDTVEDGQAALDYIEGNACPDLLLLDLNMPKKTGSEVLQEIRSGEHKALPVILVTGTEYSTKYYPPKSQYQGMIKKPFDLSEVKAKVEEIIR